MSSLKNAGAFANTREQLQLVMEDIVDPWMAAAALKADRWAALSAGEDSRRNLALPKPSPENASLPSS